MIKAYKCKDTQALFETGSTKKFAPIAKTAMRKLTMLAGATSLDDLRNPPGNRLEALTGDRDGQHSIRVNDQFRLCFVWTDDNNATDVEITDYH